MPDTHLCPRHQNCPAFSWSLYPFGEIREMNLKCQVVISVMQTRNTIKGTGEGNWFMGKQGKEHGARGPCE